MSPCGTASSKIPHHCLSQPREAALFGLAASFISVGSNWHLVGPDQNT